MAARYKLRVKDTAGVVVAELGDFVSLDYRHRVNDHGNLTLTLDSTPGLVAALERDGQIEVWRCDVENGIAWYLEWEGLITGIVRRTLRDGRQHIVVTAAGYVDLLARRIIAYYAASAGADKSGVASTVMRAFVEENAGASATVALGRLSEGVTPGLVLGTDPLAGGTWSGGRSYKNLLDVLQGIADQAGIDFDVIGTGAAAFEFRVYDGQRGADRTVTGLNRATGHNTAGNAPVVFSTALGNMIEPEYSAAWQGSANHVLVLGPGDKSARAITQRSNGADVIATPFALHEVSRDARNETAAAARALIGDAIIQSMQPRESFTFGVLQVPASLYGKHYTWGDKVTGRYEEIERNQRIVGVQVRAEDGAEVVTAEMADMP